MNINQLYSSGGDYLKAVDLGGNARQVTISGCQVQDFESDNGVQKKLVLALQGTDRQLVLNKTNAMAIGELYGQDSDGWVGKSIELRPERVPFQGRMVDAIRVYKPSASAEFQQPQQPETKPQASGQPFNDDIPW